MNARIAAAACQVDAGLAARWHDHATGDGIPDDCDPGTAQAHVRAGCSHFPPHRHRSDGSIDWEH